MKKLIQRPQTRGVLPIRLATWTILTFSIILLQCKPREESFTRGIGVYPGRPSESGAPTLKAATKDYRNIALLRPAYSSSNYDYNLTPQLITDGIIETTAPSYLVVTAGQGAVNGNEREYLFDHNRVTTLPLSGNPAWVSFNLEGTKPGRITTFTLIGEFSFDPKQKQGWSYTILGSDDGSTWKQLGQLAGKGLPGVEKSNYFSTLINNPPKDSTGKPIDPMLDYLGPAEPGEPKPSFSFGNWGNEHIRSLNENIQLSQAAEFRFYRVELNAPCVVRWELGDIGLYNDGVNVEITPAHHFSSSWMSASSSDEWVYVDLGARCDFDAVRLHWIQKADAGLIQVSDDGVNWTKISELPGGDNKTDDVHFQKESSGQYVRILMNKGKNSAFTLSEIEVMGTGGLVPVAKPQPDAVDNKLYLTGGNWQIQRASLVQDSGEKLSLPGGENKWIPATVPGTALVSYINAGILPDPNFGDNQVLISESYFNSDFWYRNEFDLPGDFPHERIFLNFDGINWKADVFFNGKKLGTINGAFTRRRFDITELITLDKPNALAVLIHKNRNIGSVTKQSLKTPDKNGGILGADNPTFHASIGWDWIPTIRGRNIGIWNDVFLSTNGAVTIEDPFVTTDLPLPDTTSANIAFQFGLKNHSAKAVTGTLHAQFGDITVQEQVTIQPTSLTAVTLDVSKHPQLRLPNPALWWPKGYGAPHLYDVKLRFEQDGNFVSDQKEFKSGVREMSFTEKNMVLDLYVNGRRFIGRGGNWGFPESNLNYRSREYDVAVKYHADMNFTMIRNWVGQTGDEEFYEACDRHGIMVWQDFWLANPWDGPDPDDNEMFVENARDLLLKIRNHPSIAIYVGRNEGNPLPALDNSLRKTVAELHPGIHYISNSASGVVSGGGPYRALPAKDYFLLYGRHKFHSERGMPNVMTFESMQKMLPESKLWPQNDQWGLHDYCLEGAQGAESFNKIIETAFGPSTSAQEFTERAQWVNYDGYRGMFEGRSRFRQGLLLWMSHSAWPSMVWQTYDYYFEPNAAYFACKKASEPIHIQWNPVWDVVEVVNNHAGAKSGLNAAATIYNLDGTVQWTKDTAVSIPEDDTQRLFKLQFSEKLSATHFVKLVLRQDDKIISENFYWRGREAGNYQALNTVPLVKLDNKTTVNKVGDHYEIVSQIENKTNTPALMVRLKVIGTETGERILPALYSDNYIFLMPGESKTITMTVQAEDTRGEEPGVVVSGFNLER